MRDWRRYEGGCKSVILPCMKQYRFESNEICSGLFTTCVSDRLPVFTLSQYNNINHSKGKGFKFVRCRDKAHLELHSPPI